MVSSAVPWIGVVTALLEPRRNGRDSLWQCPLEVTGLGGAMTAFAGGTIRGRLVRSLLVGLMARCEISEPARRGARPVRKWAFSRPDSKVLGIGIGAGRAVRDPTVAVLHGVEGVGGRG